MSVLLLSTQKRKKLYGLECTGPSGADGILFKASTWIPGGEYIQKLVIKNVSGKVIKFKYKLPSTRYFSLLYPEEIILSPGIFKEVDVIFRPVEYEPYDDTIYIKILDGVPGNGFHVSVGATIDKLILTCPENLDLAYCTTHQFTTKTFLLTNTGEVDAPFEWDPPVPFILNPSSGTITVGKSIEIVVSLMPEDASVYVSQAVCHVGTGIHAIIPDSIIRIILSAKAKYAHISLSQPEVSFEEVVSGVSPPKQKLLLKNTSPVPAEFSLIRYDTDRDEVFNIVPKEGIVPAMSDITVTVSYSALAMGCFSLDRYTFRTPGNCNAILTCKGTAIAPKVTLFKEGTPKLTKSSDMMLLTMEQQKEVLETTKVISGFTFFEAAPEFSLNFRDIEVGKVESRIFYLRNHSIRDTPFSIIADENATFKMNPKQGIIPSMYKFWPIKVIFSPMRPSNYYRRFFVLVGDGLPLFYDCLGTGYIRAKGEIKEQRPAPLRHAHIQAYRNRAVQGLGSISPDELDSMYEDEADSSLYFAKVGKVGTKALSVANVHRSLTRTGEAVRTLVAPAHEFFISDTDSSCRDITMNKVTLDFGYTPHLKSSTAKTVTIRNHTRSKVSVEWQIPTVGSIEKKKSKSINSNEDDLGKNDSMSTLKTSRENEVISSGKAERELASQQAFVVIPSLSEINPGDVTTFEVSFCPKQSNRNYVSELEAFVYFKNQRTFRLVNDHSLTPPWCLTLISVGHTFQTGQLLAKAQMLGGCIKNGKLVFPCVFVGETIYQTFMLRNTSNLPCTYKIELGWEGQGVSAGEIFSVKPAIGEIAADDFVLVCARFTATSVRNYLQLLRLYINGDDGGKLMLEGAGSIPYLILPNASSDIVKNDFPEFVWGVPERPLYTIPKGPQGTFYLKPTCVGLSNSRILLLKNGSRLPLRYKVNLNNSNNDVISISPISGILMGNEITELTVYFVPRSPEQYESVLNIYVYPIGGKTQPVKDANQPGPDASPELLQSMSLRLSAQGETTALIFDPARITAEVRLVNTNETLPIYLENVSDSDLSYQLYYKEEFEPDAASIDTTRTISEILPLIQQSAFSNATSDETKISEIKFDQSLFCERPNGILAARSKTRILFSYTPRKAGLFEFLLFAKIQAYDSAKKQLVMISNEEAVLLRISQEERESSGVQISSTLGILPLSSNITARAAFPKLLVEDVRTDADLLISDVDYLWKRFNLSQLNYDLSIPMTQKEILLNESSSPNLTELLSYKFEFSPAVVGSPMQTIFLQLRNNGYLPTEFHIHLPNEKQLELEAWCDEDEPSEEQNRLISILEELKLFTVQPKHAMLLPGESCLLTISYQHSSLKYNGLHNLPLRVFLSQGKQFFIDLIGYTLPSPHQVSSFNRRKSNATLTTQTSQHSITTSNSKQDPSKVVSYAHLVDYLLVVCAEQGYLLRFSPVPIGLNKLVAPLQRIELINVSNQNIFYAVELEPVDKFIEANYNIPLLNLANPEGFVAANSSVFLEWRFYPLEAKTYEFLLNIKYSVAPSMDKNHSSNSSIPGISRQPSPENTTGKKIVSPTAPIVQFLNFKVQATGYDPREAKPVLLESLYPGGIPSSYPLMVIPKQKVTISQDILDFTIVPQYCTAKRVVILRNISPNTACEYVIDEPSCTLCVDGLVSVKPLFGKLEPLESAVVEFSFSAYSESMIFQDRCKVIVRDIIKGNNKKQSAMKEAMMKKINRKTVSTPHESVVSRPTYSRLNQFHVNDLIPDGKTATLPSTINEDGQLIVPSTANPRNDNIDQIIGTNNGGVVDLGSFSYDETGLNEAADLLLATERTTKSRIGSVGFTQGTSTTIDRGNSRMPHNNGSKSPNIDTGRSIQSSQSGRSSSGRSSQPIQAMLGPPSILIVRLKGEVYPIETTKSVFERNKQLKIVENYNIPDQLPFIPPPGIKYFDPVFVATQETMHNKGKINISIIKDRDHELREITNIISDMILKDVLTTHDVKDYLLSTLTGENVNSIENKTTSNSEETKHTTNSDSDSSICANISYGLYFAEIKPIKSLLERFIIELNYLGVKGYANKSNFMLNNSTIPKKLPSQWSASGDELFINDINSYTLELNVFIELLEKLNILDLEIFLKCVRSVVSTSNNVEIVNLSRYINSLPDDNQTILSNCLYSLKDSRESHHIIIETNEFISENNSIEDYKVDQSKLIIETNSIVNNDMKNNIHTAFQTEEFKTIANDILNNIFIDMMQDIISSK